MKKEKFILPTFMTVNYSENKIFEGFNFKSFIRNKQSEANPICSICLANCKFPSKPDSCAHKFCYNCIKKWSRFRRFCPYCRTKFNIIIKCSYFTN